MSDSLPPTPPHPAVAPAAKGMRLDHFLQKSGLAQTGGHAKLLVQSGEVLLNGEVETRRRKQLFAGDIVECAGESRTVE